MATHSSILGWRIPWTEEPGGYSLGSQRDKPEHFGVHDLGQMLNLDLYLTLISGQAVIALHTLPNPRMRTVLQSFKG